MARLDFTLAGSMTLARDRARVEDRAFRGSQLRLVTAMLLAGRHSSWTTATLADQLWPSGPPARWQAAVRGLVSQVRRLLADVGVAGEAIANVAGSYVVDLPDLAVDVEIAREELAHARTALATDELEMAARLAGSARSVLSRPLLAGLDGPWVDELRGTVAADHFESLLVLGQARRRLTQWPAARSVLREALDREPYREDAWRELMRIEAAAGNLATALGVHEQCRRRLAEDLGSDPSPATQQLHTELLRSSPGPRPRHSSSAAGSPGVLATAAGPAGRDTARGESAHREPYVGLRPFDHDDADLFFGRDAVVQELMELLGAHRAVAVVGPSGSGKSSLVRAGLLPALAAGGIVDSDTWPVAVMTPGRLPLQALARRLVDLGSGSDGPADRRAVDELAQRLASDPGELPARLAATLDATTPDADRLLLVLDQAEELFTVSEPHQAAQLLAALTTTIRPVDARLALVATLRADFYDRAAADPEMAHLLTRSQLVVPPMSAAELEAVVVEPLRRVGGRLETGLLGRLLGEAGHRPGVLPLLQHALWELWHDRDEADVLTTDGYDRFGGLEGSLARHAEQAWSALADPGLGRRILLRGIVVRPDQAATRRPIRRRTLDGLADPEQVDATLEHLVAARLLRADRADGEVVHELAHEALAGHWPRLRDWVERQHAQLVTVDAVGRATDDWERAARDDAWLLTGRALDDAAGLLAASRAGELDLALSVREQELVERSVRARSRRRAARRVERAFSRAELALSVDPESSLLLALGVVDDVTERVPDRRNALRRLLHQALHRHRLVRRYPRAGSLLAVAPDGDLFVTASAAGNDPSAFRVHLHQIDGELVASLSPHAGPTRPAVAFTPGGTHLVSGDGTGTVRRWERATGRLDETIATGEGPVGGLDVATGSGLVAAWFVVGRARGFAVFTPAGRRVHERAPVEGKGELPDGRVLAFHPVGDRLLAAIADQGQTLELLDTSTWEVIASRSFTHDVCDLEWHHDGSCVAVGITSIAAVLDGHTLESLRSRTHTGPATLTWTPAGQRVAVMAEPSPVFLGRDEPRPETPGGPPVVLRPTRRGAVDIRGVPGTSHLLIGDREVETVDLHDVSVTGPPEVAGLAAGDGTRRWHSYGLAWSPGGDRLALGRGDGEIAIVDAATWEELDRWLAHQHPDEHPWSPADGSVAWAPDASYVASTANDGTVTMHHLTGRSDVTVQVGSGENQWWGSCAITPDSRHVAVVFEPIATVMRPDGTIVARLELPPEAHVGRALLSPDGATLAITHFSATGAGDHLPDLVLWRWASDEPPRRLDLGFEAFFFSWHPDGDRLAMTGRHRDVRIIEVATGTVVQHLHGHDITTLDAAHHPDGRLLATSGWDRTVRVWDLAAGAEVATFDALTGPPGELAFHPSRPWLAVVDWSGVVRVWTLDLDELVALATDRVTRVPTDEERRVLDDPESD